MLALHYVQCSRADDRRQQGDIGKPAQTMLRMSETPETAACADGRTLSTRIVRRRVGNAMGQLSSSRPAAWGRGPCERCKVQ